MNIVDDNLITYLEAEFDDNDLSRFQKEVLNQTEKGAVHGVLIDLSKVRVLDTYQFTKLVELANTIILLGAKPVLVGIRAGVASSLIDLDVAWGNIETAVTLEDGINQLYQARSQPREALTDEENGLMSGDRAEITCRDDR